MNQIANLMLKNVILRQARPALAATQMILSPYSTSVSQKQENKKQATSIKITLFEGDKMEVIGLDQAKKIAEKRNLKLVNIIDRDTKSNRPIYKLMTSHEYHAEELKKREEKKEAKSQLQIKSEKLLTINTKISTHDLDSKVQKVKKWVEKLHEIRVVISGDQGSSAIAEKISGSLEQAAKEVNARVLQKRSKDNTIRFTIMPDIKKEREKASTEGSAHKKLLEPENVNVQQVRSYSM